MFHIQLMSPHARTTVKFLQRELIKLTSRFLLPPMIHNKMFQSQQSLINKILMNLQLINIWMIKQPKFRSVVLMPTLRKHHKQRMVKRSRSDLKAGVSDDNVAVPIPLVDRGRRDHRNILGVIINRDMDKNQHKIAIQSCILVYWRDSIPEISLIFVHTVYWLKQT